MSKNSKDLIRQRKYKKRTANPLYTIFYFFKDVSYDQ